ncbi:MAG TPA: aminotransferase class V-fold PLP-dependent enzyme [Stellaceae bacterium]|jgi:isopenicillin-N epimerase|nr:aminotransferase class V-fold PLP-dependent enzyme [Stellaceae bacterium]
MTNFPQFGHSRLGDFALAPGIAHLNHGGYGATPQVVLQAAEAARREMEADPSTFFRRDLIGRLRQAADRVAAFLGGAGKDWAFVENATAGLNAVIASLDLEPGDELLCLSQVYGAVGNAMRYFAERRGARVVSVAVPVPFTDPEPLLAAIAAAIGPRTRLAVFDHITSAGAVVLPVREMAALCRGRGVPVAIDGAHAPGQVLLDVPALGVDWYVGNLHKWAFAAKGTGVIWCAPERQAQTHPVAISHNLGQGFAAEFDYSGTRDNSHWLAVPAALDYVAGFGGEAIEAHNRALAKEACGLLEKTWNSAAAASSDYRAAMASVRLPGAATGQDRVTAHRLALDLNQRYGLTLGVMLIDGALWVRVSAQIYNEIGDYERLAAIGKDLAG